MGLREKALQFKSTLNNAGNATLIDRIAGPADTDPVEHEEVPIHSNFDESKSVDNSNPVQANSSDVPPIDEGHDYEFIENDELPLPPEQNRDGEDAAQGQDIQNASTESAKEQEATFDEQMTDDAMVVVDEGLDNEIEESRETDETVEVKNEQDTVVRLLSGDITEIEENRPGLLKKQVIHDVIEETGDAVTVDHAHAGAPVSQKPLVSNGVGDILEQAAREAETDFVAAQNIDELLDTLLFAVMGQIGVSSSSVMLPHEEEEDRWIVAESRGVSINSDDLLFYGMRGILKEFLSNQSIVDIELYRNDAAFRDDYFNYIAIDARLLCPLRFNNETFGILVVGNKITEDEYTIGELEFFTHLGVAAGRMLAHFAHIRRNEQQLHVFQREHEWNETLDNFHVDIARAVNLADVKECVARELADLSIARYALFVYDVQDDLYRAVAVEKEDFCLIDQMGTTIDVDSRLISELFSAGGPIAIEKPEKSPVIVSLFHENQVKKMSTARFYPVFTGNKIFGFLAVFGIKDRELLDAIDYKSLRIARITIPIVTALRNVAISGVSFFDGIEIVYRRIHDEIERSDSLNIPMTLVLFSIRNYKRFYELHGHDEMKNMIESFERIITVRLSDSDFAARYDRHKILLVLPGKDKKFALPLANSVKNELVQTASSREKQLLVSFLTVEYPADGRTINELIDAVD